MSWNDSRQSLGPRASMGPRPSMGPRASLGGRQQSVQAFSFPILKTPDILQCMHELQVRLTEAEINEADKHRDAIRRAYEYLVEICTGARTGTIAIPPCFPNPIPVHNSVCRLTVVPRTALFIGCTLDPILKFLLPIAFYVNASLRHHQR